jgi:Right handed beta helix region
MLSLRATNKGSRWEQLQKRLRANRGGSMVACRSTTVFVLALVCMLTAAAEALASKSHIVFVRARTADEIVNAMLAANSSGRPTVIRVAPGTYQFTQRFPTPVGDTTLPPVTAPIAIIGKDSATTTFEPAGASGVGRLVMVESSGALLIRGVTLRFGSTRCPIDGCSENGGAAALNRGGLLIIEDSFLSANSASSVEGVDNALGGAILSLNGELWIDRTSVVDNFVRGWGAGIVIMGGKATIRRSIVSGNATTYGPGGAGGTFGGGIYISAATVAILSSTISGNRAMITDEDPNWFGDGAGLYNTGGTVWIQNSAITENISQFTGAGGGVFNDGSMVIENSTIAGNSGGPGAGIFNGGDLTLRGVTVARNVQDPAIFNEEGAELRVVRSLIANAPFGDCVGVLTSDGYNGLGSTAGCTLMPSPTSPGRDQVNVDPRLGELEDDGEAGHAQVPLLANSPMIDAGGRIGPRCSVRDQIGQRRVDGNGDGIVRCDIGAIEFRPSKNNSPPSP